MGPSGKLHSGKKEQNRTLKSLRAFFLEPKISLFPPVSIQAGKAGDQYSSVKTYWTKWNTRRKSTGHGIREISWEEKCYQVEEGQLGKLRYSRSWIWQGITTNNKNGFYRHVGQKWKIKENVHTQPHPPLCSSKWARTNDNWQGEGWRIQPQCSLVITLPTSLKSPNLKRGTGELKSLPV